jgi:hypothetical protein
LSQRRTSVNSWLQLSQAGWWLAWDAGGVIALRGIEIAFSGPRADREAYRMIEEKLKAAFALQMLALTGALGFTPLSVATKTIAHYSKAVRANQKRLGRQRR